MPPESKIRPISASRRDPVPSGSHPTTKDVVEVSGRQDSNLRPLRPKRSALPS
jgi:hypothetical protein